MSATFYAPGRTITTPSTPCLACGALLAEHTGPERRCPERARPDFMEED